MGGSLRRVLLPASTAALIALAGCSTSAALGDWDGEPLRQWLQTQLSRGLAHPVSLGPLEGIGFQGLVFGPTRVEPGPSDGSTMELERLTLKPDLLASLRQRRWVSSIGLAGLKVQLQPNAQGQLWVFPKGNPNQPPPRLRLQLALLDAARVQLHGQGSWRFADGHLDLNLPAQMLHFRGSFRPPGGRARRSLLSLQLSNRWGAQPSMQAQLLMRRMPLRALTALRGEPLPQVGGELSAQLRLQQQGDGFRCHGPLRLQNLAWPATGSAAPPQLPQLSLRCRGDQLRLKPARWRWGERSGELTAAVQWQGAPWRSLRLQELQLRSGGSQLQVAGSVLPQLALNSTVLRLEPALLGQKGAPWLGQLGLKQRTWWLRFSDGSLQTPAGLLRLQGKASGTLGSPPALKQLQANLLLQPAAPLAKERLGDVNAQLQWRHRAQRLELKGGSSLAGEPLLLQGSWQPQPGKPLQQGLLQLQAQLAALPLAALNPALQGSVSALVEVSGTAAQPKPSARFHLQQPGVMGLRSAEDWHGTWQPARLELQSPSTRIEAALAAGGLQWLTASKADGDLALRRRGAGWAWSASNWSLSPLQLSLPGQQVLPLAGVLEGGGSLRLDPLLVQGQAGISKPALAWIKGKELQLDGRLQGQRYALTAELLSAPGGSLNLNARGQLNGALELQAKLRRLQAASLLRLFQDLRRPGVAAPIGQASDLGELAINTLGQSLDQQIRELLRAQRAVAMARPQPEGPVPLPLDALQGVVDADIEVRGPQPAQYWLKLASRGHLWLRGEQQDRALQLEPFIARMNGPLDQGDGRFSFSGLPLGFIALLTPVPVGLRGRLRGQGSWRSVGGQSSLTLDLALDQASLQGQSLALERGRIELRDQLLDLDLALRGGQASSAVELKGRLPLDPVAEGLELRLASRGEGLAFLSALSGGELQWQRGSLDLQLLVRGSQQAPLANGFLRVRDGELLLAGQAVRQVQASAFFDFQRLQLEQFSAAVGSGQLSGSGNLAFQPGASSAGLEFALKQLPVVRPNLKLLADGVLRLEGSLLRPFLGGQLQLSHGQLTVSPALLGSSGEGGTPQSLGALTPDSRWDFSAPMVLLGPSVESSAGVALRRSLPSFGALRFRNLRLAFGPKLRIRSAPVADFGIGGLLTLNGAAGPEVQLSGVVRLLKGRINVLTNTLKLDSSNANVAVFTPSLGLIPYLDVVLVTRVSDQVVAGSSDQLVTANELQGSFSNLDRLNLVKVIITVRGSADRIAENYTLRSVPPLPREQLVSLLWGNSLAGFSGGNPGTALATVLGGTLLSPVLGGFSDLFGERLTASLYPAYLDPYTEDRDRSRSRQRVPSQLVLAAEVGVDLTERLNLSVLTAPNRSDIPAEVVLRYQATDTLELQGAFDQEGRWQTKAQLFFRF